MTPAPAGIPDGAEKAGSASVAVAAGCRITLR